jgi:predicted aspartyl protease
VINHLSGDETRSKAFVYTGATYTVVPLAVYEKLNLKIVGKKDVETANGKARLDETFATVEIEGKRGLTPILVSPEIQDIQIGVLTLEGLGFTVEPTTGELKETRTLLL